MTKIVKTQGPAQTFVKLLPMLAEEYPDAVAIFSTYRSIDGYESVKSKQVNGLSIRMVQGRTEAQEEAAGIAQLYSVYDEDAEQHEIYGDQQIENHKQIAQLDIKQRKQFFIVYAGLSNIKGALACIADYKEHNPDAFVVVCTCDCRFNDFKGPMMINLVKKGIINYLAVSPYCTGRRDLGLIADAMVEAWSD